MPNKTNPIIIVLLVLAVALLAFIAFKPKGSVSNTNLYNYPSGQTQTKDNANGPDYQPNTHQTSIKPVFTTFAHTNPTFSIAYNPSIVTAGNMMSSQQGAPTPDFVSEWEGVQFQLYPNSPTQYTEVVMRVFPHEPMVRSDWHIVSQKTFGTNTYAVYSSNSIATQAYYILPGSVNDVMFSFPKAAEATVLGVIDFGSLTLSN